MGRLERCMLRADELSVTGQLDALLAEDLGGRHLLLLESGDASAFEHWAYTRAAERFEGIAFLDFSGPARPGAIYHTRPPHITSHRFWPSTSRSVGKSIACGAYVDR